MNTFTADDPATLNALAREAMSAPAPSPALALDEVDDSVMDLPDTEVTLPGGYLSGMDVITEAEVRELNGLDEEAVAKTNSLGRALMTILKRGTVRIGDMKVTDKILDEMLMGDRDMLLLSIARATYGDKVTAERACPFCGTHQSFDVNLKDDVPIVRLSDPAVDRFFTVKGRKTEIRCTLPTGVTQKDIYTNLDRSEAEMKTKLLSECIMQVGDAPALGERTARELGSMDRENISREITKRNPGPRLDQVKKTCKSCEKEVEVPMTLAALFRF